MKSTAFPEDEDEAGAEVEELDGTEAFDVELPEVVELPDEVELLEEDDEFPDDIPDELPAVELLEVPLPFTTLST